MFVLLITPQLFPQNEENLDFFFFLLQPWHQWLKAKDEGASPALFFPCIVTHRPVAISVTSGCAITSTDVDGV